MVCLVAFMPLSASDKTTMAVTVFGSVSPAARNLVESAFLQRLSGNTQFVVFERNKTFLNKLNREIDFQTSGALRLHKICGSL